MEKWGTNIVKYMIYTGKAKAKGKTTPNKNLEETI